MKKGQAALIVVFGLGMMGVLVALSFSWFGPKTVIRQRALVDSNMAYFAAQSGIEELMIRLRSHHDFGERWDMSHELDNGAMFYATISGDLDTKIATATGIYKNYVRRLELRVVSSSAKTSFLFAVQSGEGGFELKSGTEIRGMGGRAGNIYSNGDVLGEKISSGTAGSKVLGDVWAVGKISGLDDDESGGLYITGNAAANELLRCEVLGDVEAPVPPGSGCSYEGDYETVEVPSPMSMEHVDIDFWKQQAEHSSVWSGDCVVDAKGGVSDCSGSEKELGSVKIEGNLVIESNSALTLTGPVWVEGDLTINSNVDVYVGESLGSEGVVVVVDYPSDLIGRGKIETESNVGFFQTSEGGPVVFVSTNEGDNCTADPAVTVASNTSTVVFSAPNGCVFFQSNSFE